jgi:hypothetical protein
MKLGILRRLQFGMMVYGIAMELVFSVYVMFFVEFNPEMGT